MLILILPISTLICLIYGIFLLHKSKVNVPPFIMMLSTAFVFSIVETYVVYSTHGFDNGFILAKMVFVILLMFLNGLNTILKAKTLCGNNFEAIVKKNFLVDFLLIISILITIFCLGAK